MNTDAPWPDLDEAERRVLNIQTKLHQWATDDPHRRFDDLFNLVADPAFLMVAWDRVQGNRGARTAGVDGVTPRSMVFVRELFLRGVARRTQDPTVQPPARAGKADPEEVGEATRVRHSYRPRPLCAGRPQAGAGANLRSGLQAVLLRFPPETSSPRRHRRDSLLHHPLV